MKLYGYELTTLISKAKIDNRIEQIAKELSLQFKNEIPILIGVLNGAFIFMSDLMRKLTIDCEMDFIKISSYAGKKSTGTVILLKDISADITGRHVIIVEDIIDSGLTIKFLRDRLRGASAKSVTIVTLLLKPGIAKLDFKIDYIGFEIPPEFVVGYGLDYDQKLRHLPEVYRLEE